MRVYSNLLSYSFKRPRRVCVATGGIKAMKGSDLGGQIFGGHIYGDYHWLGTTKL